MSGSASVPSIRERYEAVRADMARAARQAGRNPSDVALVIASKTQPVEAIEELILLGHRVFGENRVQEAQQKWPALKARYPDIVLHLIGPLQTNKVREACRLFDVIETIDRERLARALAEEQGKQGKSLDYFVEVNVGGEAQKAGILPTDAPALINLCRNELRLQVNGLMCIPPAGEQAAPFFAMLTRLANDNGLALKSMGMTADYPLAIALGATHVRVGTAIFGPRPVTEE